jgi:putative spermidine/putrescine transport system permease protein
MTRTTAAKIVFGGYIGLVLAFLIPPFLIILPMSFSATRFLTFPPPSFSLRWYQEFFGSETWMNATAISMMVALLTVAIATPVGTATAYAIAHTTGRLPRLLHITPSTAFRNYRIGSARQRRSRWQ